MPPEDKTRIQADVRVGVGTQLSGIYELDERIALGGMGEVYRGHNIQTGDPVAIKIVLPELARDETILSLFKKEASILNHLSHDAIVRYHVFTIDPGIRRPYLAMEFVNGQSLVDVMQRGPMSSEDTCTLGLRIASGLAAAHRAGIIHRDLSPDNVILPGGDVENTKIIDFGIARSAVVGGKTLLEGKFAGKYNYVSPEQLGLYGGEVSERSDIYSLGLVLAASARGEALDMSGTQVEVIEKRRSVPNLSGIDDRLRPILEAMLQPDPDTRPASMNEVVAWLSRSDVAVSEQDAFTGVTMRPATMPPSESPFGPYTPPSEPAASKAEPPTAEPQPPGRKAGLGRVLMLAAVVAVAATGGAYYAGLLDFPLQQPEEEPEAVAEEPLFAPREPTVDTAARSPPKAQQEQVAAADSTDLAPEPPARQQTADERQSSSSPPADTRPTPPAADTASQAEPEQEDVAAADTVAPALDEQQLAAEEQTSAAGDAVVPPDEQEAPQQQAALQPAERTQEPVQSVRPSSPPTAGQTEPAAEEQQAATSSQQEPAVPAQQEPEPPAAQQQAALRPPQEPAAPSIRPEEDPPANGMADVLDDVANRVAFIRNYSGDGCFYATATSVSDKATEIEGFGQSVAPFTALLEDFQDTFHVEPEIGARLIEPEQCVITDFLRGASNSSATPPVLTLQETAVGSGMEVRGQVGRLNGRQADVILIDHEGMAYSLNRHMTLADGAATFRLNVGLTSTDLEQGKTVPQVILAVVSPDGIAAARFSRPIRAEEVLPRILAEIGADGAQSTAVAKYFRLGG